MRQHLLVRPIPPPAFRLALADPCCRQSAGTTRPPPSCSPSRTRASTTVCRFPRPMHLGGRACGWAHSALQDWIANPERLLPPPRLARENVGTISGEALRVTCVRYCRYRSQQNRQVARVCNVRPPPTRFSPSKSAIGSETQPVSGALARRHNSLGAQRVEKHPRGAEPDAPVAISRMQSC
jgi:hypothetical protein